MISRHLDVVGRVVIPQEMRDKLNITHNTLMDITLKGNKIILTKSGESCLVCGKTGNILEGTQVCRECAKVIADKLNED